MTARVRLDWAWFWPSGCGGAGKMATRDRQGVDQDHLAMNQSYQTGWRLHTPRRRDLHMTMIGDAMSNDGLRQKPKDRYQTDDAPQRSKIGPARGVTVAIIVAAIFWLSCILLYVLLR
jgi:hypothetical protein